MTLNMKTSSLWSVLLFGLVLCLFTNPLSAQEEPELRPLRVGVVLSGGGAKGAAHVGALRVLEEAGIRIDYLGGTSMGGIVGGLYASGWSVDQLDSILHANDLAQVLQDQIKRDYQPFFNKQYGEKYALRVSLKGFSLVLPPALSDGQQAFDFMSELTDHVVGITDFSKLPIPFLCVGTDVSNGEQFVMEDGCLALAMRATGSFPGLLAPVEVKGKLLTDGAVVNNFPVKEVKDKGMDMIIGINVEAPLYKKEDLFSIEKLIEQIGSYQMIAHSQEQMQYCNLVIRPDLDEYGVTSFEALDTIMVRGERAARQQWEQLLQIARLQQSRPQPERVRPAVQPGAKPMQIDAVYLQDNSAITTRALLRKFPVPLPGEISFKKFRDGIAALYATDNFQYIDYHFVQKPNGHRDLYVRVREKPGSGSSLRMGLHYDNVYKSGLVLNGTFRDVPFKNSIASLDLVIGDKLRYEAHYFVGSGRGPGAGINSRLNMVDLSVDLPKVDVGGNISVEKLLFGLTDFTNEAYVNLLSNNMFALGLAAELKYFKTATEQAVVFQTDKTYIDEKGWYGAMKAFVRYDSRDRIFFTRNGSLASLELRGMQPFSSRKYEGISDKLGYQLDLRAQMTRPLGRYFALTGAVEAGGTRGTPAPPWRYFLGSINRNLINNFRPFPGLPFARYSGNNLLKGCLSLQAEPYPTYFITFGGHIASLTDSKVPFASGKDLFNSLSISLGTDTFLGPVEFTFSSSNRGNFWYFNLGHWF